jgi:hypothetical protein
MCVCVFAGLCQRVLQYVYLGVCLVCVPLTALLCLCVCMCVWCVLYPFSISFHFPHPCSLSTSLGVLQHRVHSGESLARSAPRSDDRVREDDGRSGRRRADTAREALPREHEAAAAETGTLLREVQVGRCQYGPSLRRRGEQPPSCDNIEHTPRLQLFFYSYIAESLSLTLSLSWI